MRDSLRRFQKFTAFLTLYCLVTPILTIAADGNNSRKLLTDDQKIIHVLNRLGFGARPGDVEKVRALGLQKYIDQQLNPSVIDDAVADSKVKNLEVFQMSTAEVFAKYPNPAALLRQLEGGRRGQAADQRSGDTAKSDAEKKMGEEQQPTADEQRERRQKLQELYREYDLRPANQILP
ncbi:MAG: DUF1800 family protein, partial [Acidobacteriota bacterium]